MVDIHPIISSICLRYVRYFNFRGLLMEFRTCSRNGCHIRFKPKTLWHRFCSGDCKYIAWAERKKEQIEKSALKAANDVFKKSVIVFVMLLMSESAFAISPDMVSRIADAIYLAEGGEKAVKPYGIMSVPCETKDECRRICENTIRNNWVRWQNAGNPGTYLEFLASRYAPIEAHPLNSHWLKNVKYFLERGGK